MSNDLELKLELEKIAKEIFLCKYCWNTEEKYFLTIDNISNSDLVIDEAKINNLLNKPITKEELTDLVIDEARINDLLNKPITKEELTNILEKLNIRVSDDILKHFKDKREYIELFSPDFPTANKREKVNKKIVIIGKNPGGKYTLENLFKYLSIFKSSSNDDAKLFNNFNNLAKEIDESGKYSGPYASRCAFAINVLRKEYIQKKCDGIGSIFSALPEEINGHNLYKYVYWANCWFCFSEKEDSNKGYRIHSKENEDVISIYERKDFFKIQPKQGCKDQGCLKKYLSTLDPDLLFFFAGFTSPSNNEIKDYLPWELGKLCCEGIYSSDKQYQICYGKTNNGKWVISYPHPRSPLTNEFYKNAAKTICAKLN
ncbi:MAG: hypothetical protein HQK79_22995 [Desulfobacterales bacterium]|nr:hypothetical protein [Desulfobacterales bacterium]